ncbi:MAG: hypothetical protein WDZ35_11415 [Crocinitomicaceae bacterium]
MPWIKKYAAICILLSVFPLVWVVGRSFITEVDTEIYRYIPQESDVVIEINNTNFISEIAYQRVFNEAYVLEKIEFEEVEVDVKTGIDFFSKTILFRENWSNESVWIAVVAYSNRADFEKYIQSKVKEAHVTFGKKHAIVQLSPSTHQEQLDEHLKNIANQSIKPFTTRVNLKKYFQPDNEINCYIIPPSTDVDNQLIDGHLHFDFLKDHIEIDGNFTPVSGFENTPPVKYALNEAAAFSMRSSLNVFNSIYWFTKEKIKDVPQYSQMALDYDGSKIFLVDHKWGYTFPFKTFPEIQARFDIKKPQVWQTFLDTLIANEQVRVDTTTGILVTEQGAFFQYKLNHEVFELSRGTTQFEENPANNIYFDFQMQISPLLDRTNFSVDEDNPPSQLEQTIGLSIAEEMISDLHVFDNIEQLRFQLIKESDNAIKAKGTVQMHDREGQTMIESMFFFAEAMLFLRGF